MASYVDGNSYTGELGDDSADSLQCTNLLSVVKYDNTASRQKTGAGNLKFVMNTATNPNHTWLQCGAAAGPTNLYWCSGHFGLDAAPSADIALLSNQGTTSPPASAGRYIRIGTDRKIRVYDKNGTQYGDTSTSTVSTTALTEIVVCFDTLTRSTVIVYVWIGGTLEISVDTGVTPANFFVSSPVSEVLYWGERRTATAGADLYGDDMVSWRSSASADAPHLTNTPRLLTFVQVPTSDGTNSGWTQVGSANNYANIDDGTPDGDTSYLEALGTTGPKAGTNGQSDTTMGFPGSPTILWVQQVAKCRLVGTAKLLHYAQLKSTSGETQYSGQPSNPSTTYRGAIWTEGAPGAMRPGGGSWGVSDTTATELQLYGRIDWTAGTGARVTSARLVWILYTATLSASIPAAPGRRIFIC